MDLITPNLGESGLDKLVHLFRYHMKDFSNFEASSGIYFEHERRYKDALVAAYRKAIEPLLSGPADDADLHNATLSLLVKEKLPPANKPQNLIGFRSLIALKDLNRVAAQSGALIGDLLRGGGDVFTRLDRFCPAYGELLAPVLPNGRQGTVRTLATLLLMLDRPEDYLLVQFKKINVVARALDGNKLIGFGAWPDGTEYRRVLDFAARLRQALTAVGWTPRDQIDIQGSIWVAGGGWGPGAEQVDLVKNGAPNIPISFDEIADRIEAANFYIERAVLRRYHASLRSPGFVILAGLSGSGKTWLTKLYAEAARAKRRSARLHRTGRGPRTCWATSTRSLASRS